MEEEDTLPPAQEVTERARQVMLDHWRDEGYTVPNAERYPFQWLWDSCFHAVVWAALGDADRALAELSHVFRNQDESGFVPHIDYEARPSFHQGFWGRRGASSITQPPMYGHAIAVLAESGIDPGDDLVERARLGLRFLLDERAREPASGMVTVVHPWETGADDSPRWDHWCTPTFDRARWHDTKGRLLASIERTPTGAPRSNPAFAVAPSGFNALLAFNAHRLAGMSADDELGCAARELEEAVDRRWNPDLATWVDAGPSESGSGRTRTLDALLPLLLESAWRRPALDQLSDEAAFGASFGPTGLHRSEPTFDPDVYWRGSAWPQLMYLLWFASERKHERALASSLAASLMGGAWRSGFAEHWNPDDASPLGARPQSWAALAAVVQ
jgi:hypothetical protein